MGDFHANAEALLAVRLERESLDDLAPTHSTRSLPCNDEHLSKQFLQAAAKSVMGLSAGAAQKGQLR